MVAASAHFLSAGHYAPLADAVPTLASAHAASHGLDLEVGAGTAYYLDPCLDRLLGRHGLAVDLSKHAARRAARAHTRIAAVVADVWSCIPVAQNSVAMALDVLAPRNPRELRRTLRDDGALLVVTPAPSHLAKLRQPLALLDIDRRKDECLADAFAPFFRCPVQESLTWRMELNRDDTTSLAAMLHSARHTDNETVAQRIAMLSFSISVTGAVMLRIYRPI